jgi:hypothetical protein
MVSTRPPAVPTRLPAKRAKKAKKVSSITVTGAMPGVHVVSRLMADGQLGNRHLANTLDLSPTRAIAEFEEWLNNE